MDFGWPQEAVTQAYLAADDTPRSRAAAASRKASRPEGGPERGRLRRRPGSKGLGTRFSPWFPACAVGTADRLASDPFPAHRSPAITWTGSWQSRGSGAVILFYGRVPLCL